MNNKLKQSWTEYYISLGAKEEQERILKLLEENANGEYRKIMFTPKLIAQIKGEAK